MVLKLMKKAVDTVEMSIKLVDQVVMTLIDMLYPNLQGMVFLKQSKIPTGCV